MQIPIGEGQMVKTNTRYNNRKIEQCNCKFNVKHRECLRNHPSQGLVIKCLTIPGSGFQKWNLEMWFFWGEGKPGEPGEKPLGARKRTNNKLNPHMTPGPGIKPGKQWWEGRALTTAPSLLLNKWIHKRRLIILSKIIPLKSILRWMVFLESSFKVLSALFFCLRKGGRS